MVYGFNSSISFPSLYPTYPSERDIDIPNHIDIFHLTSEIEASDKTALEVCRFIEISQRMERDKGYIYIYIYIYESEKDLIESKHVVTGFHSMPAYSN